MGRRKFRDIYGNWVYEDDEEEDHKSSLPEEKISPPTEGHELEKEKGPKTSELDWRDWIALMIASLETILLPLIIFILIMVILAVLFIRI